MSNMEEAFSGIDKFLTDASMRNLGYYEAQTQIGTLLSRNQEDLQTQQIILASTSGLPLTLQMGVRGIKKAVEKGKAIAEHLGIEDRGIDPLAEPIEAIRARQARLVDQPIPETEQRTMSLYERIGQETPDSGFQSLLESMDKKLANLAESGQGDINTADAVRRAINNREALLRGRARSNWSNLEQRPAENIELTNLKGKQPAKETSEGIELEQTPSRPISEARGSRADDAERVVGEDDDEGGIDDLGGDLMEPSDNPLEGLELAPEGEEIGDDILASLSATAGGALDLLGPIGLLAGLGFGIYSIFHEKKEERERQERIKEQEEASPEQEIATPTEFN